MKKITKSRLIALAWILGIVLILSHIVLSVYREIQFFSYDMGRYEIEDFRGNKKSFDTVAKRLLELYDEEQKNDGDIKYIIVEVTSDYNWRLICRKNTETLEGYDVIIESSEKEKESYKDIRQSFLVPHKVNLASIKVKDDRVIFSANGPYKLIYMDNWRRPYSENETLDIYVERLAPRWYEVVTK